jgi:hypothetical protein
VAGTLMHHVICGHTLVSPAAGSKSPLYSDRGTTSGF